MGRHRTEVPSVVSIIVTGLAALAIGTATVVLTWAATDRDDWTGVILGWALTIMLASQTADRVVQRMIDRADRRDERARQGDAYFNQPDIPVESWSYETSAWAAESDEDRAGYAFTGEDEVTRGQGDGYAFGTGGWVNPGVNDRAESVRNSVAWQGERMSGDAGLYGRAAWLTDETQPLSGLFVTPAHRQAWSDAPTEVIRFGPYGAGLRIGGA